MIRVAALILIGIAVLIWCFLIFVLIKQYRFATMLVDMLQFYIPLTILALVSYCVGCILMIRANADRLRPFPYEIIYLFLGIILATYLVYTFKLWRDNYSNKLYKRFLNKLKNERYSVKLFSEYNNKDPKIEPDKVNIYIRHDVDLSIPRLLKLTQIEKETGIFSTLFFRLHSEKYSFDKTIPIIKQLASDGFEIGFHYEVLSQTKGNTEEALSLFSRELSDLRKIAPISVVAHHGDKYDNHKIWPLVDKEALNIWSAYDMKRDIYLTDTGGNFMTRSNKKHIFDLIEQAKPGDNIQILIHADWWY